MSTIVKVSCIKHVYPDKTEVSFCGLDFVVRQGTRVVVLGPNGSGKTTLLSHILGLLRPVNGEISVFGLNPSRDFKKLRKRLGVVFQNVDEQIIGPTVYDDIAFSLRNEGLDKDTVEKRVHELAEVLGIRHLLDKIPHYLSGGQKKKVALAGALILSPELLIMDEPFDGLDPKSKKEIIEILNTLNRDKGVTIIITTHDINLVPDLADIIYIINKGSVVTCGKPEEVLTDLQVLRQANLEPPILVQLFYQLKESGLELNIPLNVDEAENEILQMILGRKRPVSAAAEG